MGRRGLMPDVAIRGSSSHGLIAPQDPDPRPGQLRRDLGEGCPDVTSALRRAALSAREAVLSRALEDGQEAGSYASTLLALVQTAEGGAALQIGDGVIAVGRGGGDWSWMFWPER